MGSAVGQNNPACSNGVCSNLVWALVPQINAVQSDMQLHGVP